MPTDHEMDEWLASHGLAPAAAGARARGEHKDERQSKANHDAAVAALGRDEIDAARFLVESGIAAPADLTPAEREAVEGAQQRSAEQDAINQHDEKIAALRDQLQTNQQSINGLDVNARLQEMQQAQQDAIENQIDTALPDRDATAQIAPVDIGMSESMSNVGEAEHLRTTGNETLMSFTINNTDI